MRLINVQSFQIEEFHGSNIPKYAILSHTWDTHEASFQQWTRRWTRFGRARKPGFDKIYRTCKQARQDGIPYVWVDTVCIDKSSSAELSEAINSMYLWYTKADVCYVFLGDVTMKSEEIDILNLFRRSRWFTRGWTLQELLAPARVVFYSKEWLHLGTKKALALLISEVTGVEEICVRKMKRVSEYSIAQRMSWAAKRVTTREEDLAYSLLGIFGISMPLLYGEGHQAFRRLQQEIIKVSDDQSIFAFDTSLSNTTLLAHHPSVFADRGHIHPGFQRQITLPFTMTNAGLSMTTPLIRTLSPYWVLALLNCVEVDAGEDEMRRRSLVCLPLFGKNNRFMRAHAPITLIAKTVDDSAVINNEIKDLTTRAETSYLISYFTRMYPIHGNEMDVAMKGFAVNDHHPQGFMLTFPRGMGTYELAAALPSTSLHADISFFFPAHEFGSSVSTVLVERRQLGGMIVFKDRISRGEKTRYVGIHLGLEYPCRKGGNWRCMVVPLESMWYENDLGKTWSDILEAQQAQWQHNGCQWLHYDHADNVLVAARTRFDTLKGQPCEEAIMVEVVFDVDDLLAERDMERLELE
ncbi:vegetative incompatibility protein HET-E-1 [Podospora australis]|uniref:Vegetative incompatibility protein HET-E-1 n=1 Tax=Podospora australis TaxID=1536484 RepID=A0AAN6WIT4_9PEZI|nr:vegetative incompatibility protein HET-E-1 [Podospora australis]